MQQIIKTTIGDAFFSILGPNYTENDYLPLNLSDLRTSELDIDLSTEFALQDYLDDVFQTHNVKAAYGGYLEKRNLYTRSSYFGTESSPSQRNIHLGLDIWAPAGTTVYSPISGRVHSQNDNKNFGDYGPTIILEHKIANLRFYSLFGHLSKASLNRYKVGDTVRSSQPLAHLGAPDVNGNYPPHLHYQLILNLQNYIGDYPGVSSEQDLLFYSKNCPNPNVLLNFNS
jgi:murein DD-endopeptidase MepM/ murein hydrolase activator NlpD